MKGKGRGVASSHRFKNAYYSMRGLESQDLKAGRPAGARVIAGESVDSLQ